MMQSKKWGLSFLILFLIPLLYGCATYKPLPPSVSPPPQGIYHEVQKGETLWRISQVYGVNWKVILKANNIKDYRNIKTGEILFIPGVKEKKVVSVPFFPKTNERFSWPANGKVVKFFGKGRGKDPRGVDISLPVGKEVRASRSGKVVFAGVKRGFGNLIIIDHGDNFFTVYGYNSRLLVKEKSYVRKGEVIALSGDWGNCNKPMLHFEIRKGNEAKNPLNYLP